MADAVEAAPRNQDQRHAIAKLRRRRDDLWIAGTALVAAMLALPLAQNSWHGPEVAAVLAVSATAMLANQRWAIALVVIAQLMLLPTVLPRAFLSFGADLLVPLTGFLAVAALVPGLLAMRRAAAALVLITGWQRTQKTCRRFHSGLIAIGILVATLPFL
jgi:hypothetical protein